MADLVVVDCAGCGQPVLARSASCWRCGTPVARALSPPTDGLGTISVAVVIVAVFAVVLLGVVTFAGRAAAIASHDAAVALEREAAIDEARREAEAAARTPRPSPTPQPSVAEGMHLVQRGESLFSVAQLYGLSPNELIYWNADQYPRLQSTPALEEGWVLRITGPPLPTPSPRPTRAPRPTTPTQPGATPNPVAGLPAVDQYGPAAFPVSDLVTVSYYPVTGSTPNEIIASEHVNGPWSDWIQGAATAQTRPSFSYNFFYRTWSDGGCDVVLTAPEPISRSYTVVLPAWTPSEGTSAYTVRWWNQSLIETVAHEGHHIEIFESLLPAMNAAVTSGGCATVSSELNALQYQSRTLNCHFDMAEYGAASGLTMESCLNQ